MELGQLSDFGYSIPRGYALIVISKVPVRYRPNAASVGVAMGVTCVTAGIHPL